MTMPPTDRPQTPSECKHFYAGWLCKRRKKRADGTLTKDHVS